MEVIIKISDRDVKFKATGSAPLRYKLQFGRDFFADLFKLEKATKNPELIDLEVFYNLAWIFAKIADPTILPPLEWLDTFDEFPIMDIVPQIQDLMSSCLRSKPKN